MWKLLILAGAGIGAYALYKHMSDQDSGAKGEGPPPGTPDPPPAPPGVINLSWDATRDFYGLPQAKEIVWVSLRAVNFGYKERNRFMLESFPSEAEAAQYASELVEFVDKHSHWWTCSDKGGVVQVTMSGFTSAAPGQFRHLVTETWTDCQGSVSSSAGAAPPSVPTAGPSKPVYVVGYQVHSGFQNAETYFFKTEEEATRWYETLQAFFLQPPIRVAYTWPQGHVSVEKFGPPPSVPRFTMVDENGVLEAT